MINLLLPLILTVPTISTPTENTRPVPTRASWNELCMANALGQHGQNYVAKVHLEMEKTDDHAQRYNLKRRLEEVLGDRQELAIWTNLILKEGGYA